MDVSGLFSKRRGLASALLMSGLLSACGGGGDDGGGSGSTPPPINVAPRIVITDANAPSVSTEALQSLSAAGSSVGNVAADSSLSRGIGPAVKKASATWRKIKPGPRSQAMTTNTWSCSGGGSFTLTISVAGSVMSAGDSTRFVFNGCREADATTSGSLVMTVVSSSGTGENLLLTADVALTDLATTVTGVTETANGTLRLIVDDTNSAVTRIKLTSPSVVTRRTINTQVLASRALANVDLNTVLENSTGRTSTTATLTASGNFPRLGEGSLQVETLQAITTAPGVLRPSSGRLRATGANGGNVLVTLQTTGLLLEVDRDSNGTIDFTRSLSWPEVDDLIDG